MMDLVTVVQLTESRGGGEMKYGCINVNSVSLVKHELENEWRNGVSNY